MKVVIYQLPGNKRSEMIASVMRQGIYRVGDEVTFRLNYREPEGDVAVFYGLMKDILNGYRSAGKKAIYVDLGYWGRHEGGRREGYHKFAINSRHPTSYFQSKSHSSDRFDHFGVKVHPRRQTNGKDYILLAGMSAKAAHAEGFAAEQWERKTALEIRKYTQRRIVYRPKPNWPDFNSVPGTELIRGNDDDLENYLGSCHAVVTHHSNVAVDAVLYGVPAFCMEGAATPQGAGPLSQIDAPLLRPEESRRQWANDLAYAQWSVPEMRDGTVWRHFKDEGLVP